MSEEATLQDSDEVPAIRFQRFRLVGIAGPAEGLERAHEGIPVGQSLLSLVGEAGQEVDRIRHADDQDQGWQDAAQDADVLAAVADAGKHEEGPHHHGGERQDHPTTGPELQQQGEHEEAERVYRTDLGLNNELQRCAQHQGNIWSLHGLVECLAQRGESEELTGIQAELESAREKSDFGITSSCCCRKKVASF